MGDDGSPGQEPDAEDDFGRAPEIMDISNSPAFKMLTELVNRDDMHKDTADSLKEMYETLHKNILELYDEEKQSLKNAKKLRQDLLAEKIKLEKISIRKHEDGQLIMALDKDRDTLYKEMNALQMISQELDNETQELQREKGEAERALEIANKENLELVEPEFKKNRERIRELEEDAIRQDRLLEGCKTDRQNLQQRHENLENEIEELKEENLVRKQYLNKIKADPERIARQVEVVETAAANLTQEVETLEGKILEYNGIIEEQDAKKQELSELGRELTRKLDMHRSTIEQRERDVSSLRKSFELEKSQHQDLLAKRVHVELMLKEEKLNAKQSNQDWTQAKKDFETQKRLLKKRIAQLDNIKVTIPQTESNLNDLVGARSSYFAENKQLTKSLTELKQEVDIFIANYLKQENIEKDKKETLETRGSEIKECEHQISLWVAEEHKQGKQISMLSAQREIKAREASKAYSLQQAAVEELKIKELTLVDLTKKLTDTNSKLREFSALYDVVKNERNKYVNLIQASSQALAEMKEKIKILQNEVEILRNESIAKDRALTKERLAHQTAQCQRDSARHEMNRCQATYRDRQNNVEQQIVEIDKLNSIINTMEKAMLRLKKQYEVAVENRNFTGVQLIDRNDELCILYEKANLQEETLKTGELGLREKEEQVRLLKLQIAELERSLAISRAKIPVVPEMAERVLTLKRTLAAERGLTAKLCEDLETPDNDDRWRALLGEDPDLEQLQAKLQVLEERLNVKKEQYLEKELVLEEVSELSEKLKVKAMDGKKKTLKLAKTANDFQARIKETTRKMMAIVSELSMYQATAMKLQQEKHEREKLREEAEWKLRNGQAPTEEAEYEWYRVERMLNQAEVPKSNNAAVEDDPMAPSQKGPARTTAEQRPNAYIPEGALGVPRPYGAQAPFKPTEPGSTMRHIRDPVPKEIEI